MQAINAAIVAAASSSSSIPTEYWEFEHKASLGVRVDDTPDLVLEAGLLEYSNATVEVITATRVKAWTFTLEHRADEATSVPCYIGGFYDDTHYVFPLKVAISPNMLEEYHQLLIHTFVIRLHPEMYKDLKDGYEVKYKCSVVGEGVDK